MTCDICGRALIPGYYIAVQPFQWIERGYKEDGRLGYYFLCTFHKRISV